MHNAQCKMQNAKCKMHNVAGAPPRHGIVPNTLQCLGAATEERWRRVRLPWPCRKVMYADIPFPRPMFEEGSDRTLGVGEGDARHCLHPPPGRIDPGAPSLFLLSKMLDLKLPITAFNLILRFTIIMKFWRHHTLPGLRFLFAPSLRLPRPKGRTHRFLTVLFLMSSSLSEEQQSKTTSFTATASKSTFMKFLSSFIFTSSPIQP